MALSNRLRLYIQSTPKSTWAVPTYTSGTDFLKLLSSLLRNDEKLLRPETIDLMFGYGLPNKETFRHFRTNPEHLKDNFGDLAPVGMEVDHCLAGMVNQADLLGGRKAGSITWQGATCCYWVLPSALPSQLISTNT